MDGAARDAPLIGLLEVDPPGMLPFLPASWAGGGAGGAGGAHRQETANMSVMYVSARNGVSVASSDCTCFRFGV